MNEQYKQYLQELRARHEADLETLRAALVDRHPSALGELKQCYAAVERETARILDSFGSKKGAKQ